jgi:hypothetical protein
VITYVELPQSEATNTAGIAAYKPITGGRPARMAYPIVFGIRMAETVRPAKKSLLKTLKSYLGTFSVRVGLMFWRRDKKVFKIFSFIVKLYHKKNFF